MAQNNQDLLTGYVFHGPPAAVQQAMKGLTFGANRGNGSAATMGAELQQSSGITAPTTSTRTRSRGGTRAQHAKAGQEGGLATATKRGRKARSSNGTEATHQAQS